MHGMVRWFSAIKGYGFLAPDDGGDDVFVRLEAGALIPGEPVTFRVVDGADGPEARHVSRGHLPDDEV